MNHQQAQRNFATNGVGGRRNSSRSDVQNWRAPAAARPSSALTNSSPSPSPTSTGRPSVEDEDGRAVFDNNSSKRPLHDRLLYLTMCLIGQYVDVQVKNGSVYTGIFHTANAEKDFGVVLKMARLTKDGSVKGGKSDAVKEAAKKPPQRTMIIHAKDFVQIIAKDVSLTGESLPNGRATKENKHELITDPLISQNRRENERELKPWKPDNDAPKSLGLESTFQNSHNRNWDQFETNKMLFGVQSTFDEHLYTTKLEKGPQTREREKEASRIAREIEGESTRNIHLAEERGYSHADFDKIDEETRYSAVIQRDDAGYEDEEDGSVADNCNDETFGGSGAVSACSTESNVGSPTASSETIAQESAAPTGKKSPTPPAAAPAGPSPDPDTGVQPSTTNSRSSDNLKRGKKQRDEVKTTSGMRTAIPPSDSVTLDTAGGITPPPASALPIPVVLSSSSAAVSHSRNASIPPASASDTSLSEATVTSKPATHSISSQSSKKSTLNPNAKEFKLNPNAKVFTPSFTPRPASPVGQSPVYMTGVIPPSPIIPVVGVGQFVQPAAAQPTQLGQFNTSLASTVSAAPFIQPTSAYVPGPAAVASQASIKLSPPTQPQVAAYNPQQMRFLPPTYPHQSGPLYGPQLIYQQPLVYMMPPQGILQGQPMPLLQQQQQQQQQQQGPLPPQPSAQLSQPHNKQRGGNEVQ